MRTETRMGSSRSEECLRSPRRHELAHAARRAKPKTAPARVKRDALLSVEIKRVFDANFQVYGVRKVWRQLKREGYDVARCTVARLMKKMALQGVIRGRRVRTTVSDKATPC